MKWNRPRFYLLTVFVCLSAHVVSCFAPRELTAILVYPWTSGVQAASQDIQGIMTTSRFGGSIRFLGTERTYIFGQGLGLSASKAHGGAKLPEEAVYSALPSGSIRWVRNSRLIALIVSKSPASSASEFGIQFDGMRCKIVLHNMHIWLFAAGLMEELFWIILLITLIETSVRSARRISRKRRRNRELCPECAYPVCNERCPECGCLVTSVVRRGQE